MIYAFDLGQYIDEVTKNNFCVKGKGSVYLCRVTRKFSKFRQDCKNLIDQALLGWHKTVISLSVLQAVEADTLK